MITQVHQEGSQFINPCHPNYESSGLCKMSTLGLLGREGISFSSINSHRFFFHKDVKFNFKPVNFPADLVVGLSTAHPASREDPLRPDSPSHCLHVHIFRVFLLKQMMKNCFLPTSTLWLFIMSSLEWKRTNLIYSSSYKSCARAFGCSVGSVWLLHS